MEINELKPVISLMTAQEERLSRQIKDTHEEVKSLSNVVGETNVRLSLLEKTLEIRELENQPIIDEVKKARGVIDFFNKVKTKPNKYIWATLIVLIVVSSTITIAIENKLLSKLLDLVRLLI